MGWCWEAESQVGGGKIGGAVQCGGACERVLSLCVSASVSYHPRSPPGWCSRDNRWAPENLELTNGHNVVFFSDNSPDVHRVGWAMSSTGASGSWTQYSQGPMDLGDSKGGEIDQHIFRDTDGE